VNEKSLGYFKFLIDFPHNMQELAQIALGGKISFKPRPSPGQAQEKEIVPR
jgi:hypothetical protein